MLKLGLIGFGKMGQRVHALAEANGFEVVRIFEDHTKPETHRMRDRHFEGIDVFIDFTHPSVVKNHIQFVLEAGKPLVIGTTGWYDTSGWIEKLCAQHAGKAVYGSNFSLGVQLFFKLVERAGELYAGVNFHASVHEIHHNLKADAPSGTAKTMAKSFLKGADRNASDMESTLPHDEAPQKHKLYVTSERNSVVIGEHRLRIGSEFDDIEIIHRARSRDAFAEGALKTAKWLTKVPSGFYLLENVIEEIR